MTFHFDYCRHFQRPFIDASQLPPLIFAAAIISPPPPRSPLILLSLPLIAAVSPPWLRYFAALLSPG
jgi:hypothetical protein